ncbi:hypothetical protein SLS58_009520 [Diplodia intermedia]|uniref:Transmembrane protein n=1 Tax=Diplodia intermedia TaxID=856260 RepID=A0ABR3TBQ0_9PEZI
MYLSFCTPSDPGDEFLLTENAYDIYEGPVSHTTNPFTGENHTTACTEYHNFSAVSPKVMMVLRSTLLPNDEEDGVPGTRESRLLQRELHRRLHTEYDMTGSLLEDLPVAKARNSYTRFVDGAPFLVDGDDGTPRADHRFDFPLFPLSSNHVQKINAVILNESHDTSAVVFADPAAARRAIDFYLADPCDVAGAYPLKIVSDPYDRVLLQLQKLERAAALLGSSVRLMYNVHVDDSGRDFLFEQAVLERLRRDAGGAGYTGSQFTPPPRWQYQHLLLDISEYMKMTKEERRRWERREPEKKGSDRKELKKKEAEKEEPKEEAEKKELERNQVEKTARGESARMSDEEYAQGLEIMAKALKGVKDLENDAHWVQSKHQQALDILRLQAEKTQAEETEAEKVHEERTREMRYELISRFVLLVPLILLGVIYYCLFYYLWKSCSRIRSFLPRRIEQRRPLTTEPGLAEAANKAADGRADAGLDSSAAVPADSPSGSENDDEASVRNLVLMVLAALATLISAIVVFRYVFYWCENLERQIENFVSSGWKTGRLY